MFEYRGKILEVYDGDTFKAEIDLGFGVALKKVTFRMYGINAPEMKGTSKDAGTVTRDRLRSLIHGKDVTLKTHKDKQEKYGRWLAEVYTLDGVYVNDLLIKEGLVTAFMLD
jgi:micrococcal nuclease